jgi:hypothetical protein
VRILLFTIIAAFVAETAIARTGWQGRAVIVEARGDSCEVEEVFPGQDFASFFLPARIDDNGPESYISFYGHRNAFSIGTRGLPARGKTWTGVYINSYGKFSTPPDGEIRDFDTEQQIDETTPFINATLKMTNWATVVGCTVTLELSYVRRR